MSDETTLLPCHFCGEKPWEPTPKRWINTIGDESWSASVHCPECEITVDTECWYETAEAAIKAAAKKWNTRATVGNGTCEMVTDWDYIQNGIPDAPEDTWAYKCSACGWSFRYDRGIMPSFCPECGRQVER